RVWALVVALAATFIPAGFDLSWFWKVRRLVCARACRQSTIPNSVDAEKMTNAATAREARQPDTGGYASDAPTITRKPCSPRRLPPPSTLLFSHANPGPASKLPSRPPANPPRQWSIEYPESLAERHTKLSLERHRPQSIDPVLQSCK